MKKKPQVDPAYQFVKDDGHSMSVAMSDVRELVLTRLGDESERAPRLKAEWWELWHVRPGEKPMLVRPYGEPIPHWLPDHAFPTKAGALFEKKRRGNRKFDKIAHVRRYVRVKVVKGDGVMSRAAKKGRRVDTFLGGWG